MNLASADSATIVVHDGTKKYGDNTVFEHVTLELRPGTYTTFTGPNGSGKSTLMSCILGQELLTGGKIFLNRAEIRPGNTTYAQQVFGLNDAIGWLPGLTVGQHLELLSRNSIFLSKLILLFSQPAKLWKNSTFPKHGIVNLIR